MAQLVIIPSMDQVWQIKGGTLPIGKGTLVMGILNVPPDSFSDGNQFLSPAAPIIHAEKMISDGADIIDIGGESTRPGGEPVTAEEEIARVAPVIAELTKRTRTPISIATPKSEV